MNQAVVPVVSPVAAELAGLAQAELRPGLAEIALALARNVLDNPRAAFEPRGGRGEAGRHFGQAASGGAVPRRGGLALVRTMTDNGGGTANRDPEIS
jgi:hypothetical protein